jgi:tetratricopeptide (TPR) repeat protein
MLLLAGPAACRSSPAYRAPHYSDPEVNYRAIVNDGKKGIPVEDEALWRCELASAAILVGEERVAFNSLHAASGIMGTLESTSAENARATFGQESIKTWKGDPHERCMNALYKGVLYWRRGDLDNASACFKRGLLADGWSEAGAHQRDFEVLMFLLGWVSALRGDQEQADFSFREAALLRPENRFFLDPRPLENNVLVLAGLGFGPRRIRAGNEGEDVRYVPRLYEERALEVLVDGFVVGRTEMATDVYHQAVTRGDKVIDRIRRGKAVFKTGTRAAGWLLLYEGARVDDGSLALLGAALLVISSLTRPEADIRHWSALPGEMHVLPLTIAPGPHRLTVRTVDRDEHLNPAEERHFDVDVPPGPGTLYYFRTADGNRILGLTDAGVAQPRPQPVP